SPPRRGHQHTQLTWHRWEGILKSDESCILNPRSEICNWTTVQSEISDFGLEMGVCPISQFPPRQVTSARRGIYGFGAGYSLLNPVRSFVTVKLPSVRAESLK